MSTSEPAHDKKCMSALSTNRTAVAEPKGNRKCSVTRRVPRREADQFLFTGVERTSSQHMRDVFFFLTRLATRAGSLSNLVSSLGDPKSGYRRWG